MKHTEAKTKHTAKFRAQILPGKLNAMLHLVKKMDT